MLEQQLGRKSFGPAFLIIACPWHVLICPASFFTCQTIYCPSAHIALPQLSFFDSITTRQTDLTDPEVKQQHHCRFWVSHLQHECQER
jgi:hypothetical protein